MFIIKKRNKYFAGTSYATGLGTSHSWSTDKDDAQIFLYKDQAEYKAVETHGKVFEIVWREKQKKRNTNLL